MYHFERRVLETGIPFSLLYILGYEFRRLLSLVVTCIISGNVL